MNDTIGLRMAAPLLLALLAACSPGQDEHAAHATADAAAATPVTAVDGAAVAEAGVVVSDAWIRVPPAGAPVAGGYLTLRNGGPQDDRLLSLRSDVAGRIEIHEMSMDNEVMKMRELVDGLPLPAGQDVRLEPGGLHLMFMQPSAELHTLDSTDVTLVFEQAGEQQVSFRIGADAEASVHEAH